MIWLAYDEMTKEVRHGQRSLYIAAHLPSDLPSDVVEMASGVFQFGAMSVGALRQLRDQCHLFRSVSMNEVAELPNGSAFGGFRMASNGLYTRDAQLFHFRESCIDTGGETVRRG